MPADPGLAIIIPIYRQPGLAVEAIACALREAEAVDGVVILVNDGCPFAETQALCVDFATAHPGRIDAIRTANAGLSAARNRGVRHALGRFPALEAIFLLDADNRLKPGAMRRALACLHQTGADWVYPDADMFGLDWQGDMAGRYLVLRHLAENICDAGSLIHARVFAAGLEFDAGLRDGYEDWDFWLRCIAAGFRGAHCPGLGFQYRARPESMVRDADRMRPELVAGLQRRHAALYDPAHLLRLEHREAPRFCLVHADRQCFDFTSAPGASSHHGAMATLEALFWQAACHGVRQHFPPFIVQLDRAALLELLRLRLADWLFWQIETLLEDHDAVAVHLLASPGRIACRAGTAGDESPAQMVAIRLAGLHQRVRDPAAALRWTALRLEAPFQTTHGAQDLASLAALLRAGAWRQQIDASDTWRTRPLIAGDALYREVRRLTGARGPLARSTGREAAIVTSQPTLPPAVRALARAGWHLRVIFVGQGRIDDGGPVLAVCDALCLCSGAADPAGLLGLLAGCAAVIDWGTGLALAVMGRLRQHGVVTGFAVTAADVPTALAYDHALELVIAPTPGAAALCRASGIPAEKLAPWDGSSGPIMRPPPRPHPWSA